MASAVSLGGSFHDRNAVLRGHELQEVIRVLADHRRKILRFLDRVDGANAPHAKNLSRVIERFDLRCVADIMLILVRVLMHVDRNFRMHAPERR